MGIQFLKMNTMAKCFLATLLACFLLSVIAAPGSTPSADNGGLIPNDSSDDSIYLQYPDDEYYDDEYYNDYYPDNGVGPGRRKRSTDNDRCSGEWKTYDCDRRQGCREQVAPTRRYETHEEKRKQEWD